MYLFDICWTVGQNSPENARNFKCVELLICIEIVLCTSTVNVPHFTCKFDYYENIKKKKKKYIYNSLKLNICLINTCYNLLCRFW